MINLREKIFHNSFYEPVGSKYFYIYDPKVQERFVETAYKNIEEIKQKLQTEFPDITFILDVD